MGAPSRLVADVDEAVKNAWLCRSKLCSELLVAEPICPPSSGIPRPSLEGMNSPRVRHLLNNLGAVPKTSLLSVGLWKGLSHICTMYGNSDSIVGAVGIDNWQTFGGPYKDYLKNIEDLSPDLPPNRTVRGDCFNVDPKSLLERPATLLCLDGDHAEEPTRRALLHFLPACADEFVLVVDDWQFDPAVRNGIERGIAESQLEVVRRWVMPSWGVDDRNLWWCGVAVFVLKKRTDTRQIVNLLESGEVFSYCKFGDGEIACARGDAGANRDGHDYSKSLGTCLTDAFTVFAAHPGVVLGQWVYDVNGEQKWLCNRLSHLGISPHWGSHEALLHNSFGTDLEALVEFYLLLREDPRPKLLVRPARIGEADRFLHSEGITVSETNCWNGYDKLRREVLARLKPNAVLLTCCGMPAKPLIAEVLILRPDVSCFDIGSGIDPLFQSIPTRDSQLSHTEARSLYPGVLT